MVSAGAVRWHWNHDMAKPIPEDNEPKTDSGKIADFKSPDFGKLKINAGLVTEITSAARGPSVFVCK